MRLTFSSHWPDCNWCSKGTNHLGGPNQGGNGTSLDGDDDSGNVGNDPYENGGDDSDSALELSALNNIALLRRDFSGHGVSHRPAHRRMMRRKRDHPPQEPPTFAPVRRQDSETPSATVNVLGDLSLPTDGSFPIPTLPPNPNGLPTGTTTKSSVKTLNGTPAPAQAAAKTQQTSKCTPSPTKSLAPSASAFFNPSPMLNS